jgi:hypothetical protein
MRPLPPVGPAARGTPAAVGPPFVARRWRLDSTPEEAVPTVTNELLHLALRPLTAAADMMAPANEDAAGLYETALCQAEEVIVDRLSYALADAWESR